MRLLKVVSVVVLTVTVLAAQQKNPLTNADVIKMVKAGMAETTIAAAIAANDTQFDLSSTGPADAEPGRRQQQGDPRHAGGRSRRRKMLPRRRRILRLRRMRRPRRVPPRIRRQAWLPKA